VGSSTQVADTVDQTDLLRQAGLGLKQVADSAAVLSESGQGDCKWPVGQRGSSCWLEVMAELT